MLELKEQLDLVFRYMSAIPVKGNSVEIMTAAKDSLRKAYAIITEKEEERNSG